MKMIVDKKRCGRGQHCLNPRKNEFLDGCLPIEEFYIDKYKTSGYRSECKACCNQPPVFAKKYRSERDTRIIEAYLKGISTITIFEQFNASLSTIYKILRDNHIPKIERYENLTGKVFERLTVVESIKPNENHYRLWKCICVCGKTIEVNAYRLTSGHTQSCGCLSQERFRKMITKHGQGKAGEETPEYLLWKGVGARSEGGEDLIELEDIVIPEFCPILGIKLKPNKGKMGDDSPTLDRIDNSKGYVKGNVAVISLKANAMKRNGSLDDIKKLAIWMEANQKKDK